MTFRARDTFFDRNFNWIGDWAGRRAQLTPKKEAIFDKISNKRYSYEDLNFRANQLARVLMDEGISKGDRVGMFSSNRIECVDLFLATAKIGAVLVPFNIRLSLNELDYLIKKTAPSIFFYEAKLIEKVLEIKNLGLIQTNVLMGDTNLNEDLNTTDLMRKQASTNVDRPKLNSEDPHLILFTGGTTGLPKGAVLPHRLIFWNSINTIVSWGLNCDDVQPLMFPLFHTGGWNVLLVPFYHLGAKTILMGDFDPKETLKTIKEEKCTIVIGVPTMFHMMANLSEFASSNFESVRVFISGGAPCPVAIMEPYWQKGNFFKMGYGLTEVGPNNFYLPEDYIKRKPTSVGLPVLHCDTRILNTETNEIVNQGEVGELLLKGPHIFSGYWDEPEETKKTIEPDGWVHTGDLVMQDEDGFYYIVGRRKEMYISGGENVYPVEIEEILFKHPAVDLAAVIGVPDEKWGEVGKAFITLKPGKQLEIEEIREYLSEKLGKYKIPKYYEIRDSLPTSATGKILKRELE
ncbi:MAG: long-chain fatty acid--CoA ligase [Promethearchaeota archaeon]|nr:MAG: long-chain fatty acid--CoA ligase [Candidatus Lokiarchaeota archaeon]